MTTETPTTDEALRTRLEDAQYQVRRLTVLAERGKTGTAEKLEAAHHLVVETEAALARSAALRQGLEEEAAAKERKLAAADVKARRRRLAELERHQDAAVDTLEATLPTLTSAVTRVTELNAEVRALRAGLGLWTGGDMELRLHGWLGRQLSVAGIRGFDLGHPAQDVLPRWSAAPTPPPPPAEPAPPAPSAGPVGPLCVVCGHDRTTGNHSDTDVATWHVYVPDTSAENAASLAREAG